MSEIKAHWYRGYEISISQEYLPNGRCVTDATITPADQEAIDRMGPVRSIGGKTVHARAESDPLAERLKQARHQIDVMVDDV